MNKLRNARKRAALIATGLLAGGVLIVSAAPSSSALSPPTAVNDLYATTEDTPLSGLTVLANDTASSPVFVNITQPVGGVVTVGGGNTLNFTPQANWDKTVTFTYTICETADLTLCSTATVTIKILPVNDPPLANDDLAATAANTATIINVLGNDTDVDTGDTANLFVQGITSPPLNGTAAVLPDGTVQYTPAPGFIGTDGFEYQVCDTHNACDFGHVSVWVSAIGLMPTAVPDAFSTPEDTPVDVNVLSNDYDSYNALNPLFAGLTINAITQPAHGNATVNTTVNLKGIIHYIPDPNWHGLDSLTYLVCNAQGGCSSAILQISVESENDLPVARDDFALASENGVAVNVKVLANDSDEDSLDTPPQSIYVHAIVTPPTRGTAVIVGTGPTSSIDYTPNSDLSGPDKFQYQICDTFDVPGPNFQGGCATAWVKINVAEVNAKPVALDDFASGPEDLPIIGIDVLANDSDTDSTPVLTSVEQPSHGTTAINFGKVDYTPAPNFHGSDSFSYRICDNVPGSCSDAVVHITIGSINDTPLAQDDITSTPELNSPNYAVANPSGFLVINVLANDSDPDGDPLHFPVPAITAGPSNGSAWISGGMINYIPDAGFVGTDNLTYEICDPTGGLFGCSTANVKIFVLDINLAPHALPDFATTDEDPPIALAIPVLANDFDQDGFALVSFGSITQPSHGEVVVNGSILEYTPDLNFHGQDSFTYSAIDQWGAVSNVTTVTITVRSVPDNPVANADLVITNEDQATTITPLDNDTDADGDTLKVCAITSPPSLHAFATITGGGTSILYTPGHGDNGHDSITYQVCDGTGRSDTATIDIIVLPVNAAPDAIDDVATTPAGDPVDIAVKANDKDADGDALTVNSLTNAAHGTVTINPDNTVHYVPNYGFKGQDTFTYTVCDPSGACDTATVTVSVGFDEAGFINGRVYFDTNGNGVRDLGEADIQGVKVDLYTAGTDGIFNTLDDVLVSSGTIVSPYEFDGLPAATYQLRVDPATVPQGLVYTDDPSGQLDGMAIIAMGFGKSFSDQDFGLWIGNDMPETR